MPLLVYIILVRCLTIFLPSKQAQECAELQRELGKRQRSEDDLMRELDECHYLLQSKEADCTRLAKDLGASQVREAELQVKWTQELQRVKNQFEFKISRQEKEVIRFKPTK